MANWIHEKRPDGDFITYENPTYSREAVFVDATNAVADVEPGTVVEYKPGKYALTVHRVRKGTARKVAGIVRHALVIKRLLTIVVVDGPDAGSDTTAERAAVLTALENQGVVARD